MSIRKSKISFTTKYGIFICMFLLAANFLLGIVLMTQSKKAMTELIQGKMLGAAKVAAASLDGDLLGSVTSSDVSSNSENYQLLLNTLKLFQDNMDMEYVYAVRRINDTKYTFIVDPDPVDPGKFGETITYTEALSHASLGMPSVDEKPSYDRWGYFYSAYCPVYDSEGRLAGIVGVDYDARWYDDQVATNTASILLISIFSLLICGSVIFIATNRFSKKIKDLNEELFDLSNEVDCLNKEVTANAKLQKSTAPASWQASAEAEDVEKATSFDVLGDRIRQARQDVKQYVSFIREQDYVDPLTGVGNKTAYLEYAKDLDLHFGNEELVFSTVVLNVNNLKSINDRYDLKLGDRMIIDTATLLLRVFDPKTVFHLEGGNFIVFMEDANLNSLNKALEDLQGRLAVFNACEKNYETDLSFIWGSSTYDASTDQNCGAVIKKAMEDLSKNKALYYQKNGDRRKQ